ncbi:NADH dehydrogenase ubiquinone 1 alpha subcomplex subunit 6 [Heterostelium album PN500]|uniref:NADH dehydrogenase ubiquinone 1 alpha subcomplex subunit 6 n=1 Tax=Heterostelium pallidum (strain ATCC 26659 / Pp 5 / PN500) TaxID=670386 RepID=D3AWB5_HETP5|nr:NADH dehydrogenase ubiquinone 1 alpha subcomplex subunit 6 [Heterostelium album PN500]EFA86588.1 NADH dehydrogenase ubiquinone 1 alpha subcomplex subunit 6 [Heterostelium album PN500]|eukprot:XP_020438693.1 NADH dehydrogenase ubiquinone 1 alpha subcomplex subunit 6 [Heterostelium album PN500]
MSSNLLAIKTLRPAIVSASLPVAQKRCLKLYRNALRSVPVIIQYYNLSYNVSEMKQRIRADFEQYSNITDKTILDRVAFIGETELFDAVSLLKTRSHVVNYFEEQITPAKQLSEGEDLLKKFFAKI